MSSLKDSIDITPAEKKTLLKLLRHYLPNTEVWAYGSRVSWTSRPTSDLDLVAFALPKQKAAVSKLREALEASNLPFRVDLFIWDEVPETFRESIRETHVVSQESEKEELGQIRGAGVMSNRLKLAEGWSVVNAETFCKRVADGTHDSPKRVDYGKDLVTSKNIIGGKLDLSTCYKISEEDYQNINKRSKVDCNDVLISMIGTVGESCFIDEEPDFAIKNVGLLKNESREKGLWLHFYLTSPAARSLIAERLRGTTQQYLPLGEIRAFPVPIPPSEIELNYIVGILASIRDKIALNRKLNETLEGMARALFQSWFVDFDPVKAKLAAVRHDRDAEKACVAAISGKLRIHPGKPKPNTLDDQLPTTEELDAAIATLNTLSEAQHNQLAQTAAHFPATFKESELGLIPKGWKIDSVYECADVIYGAAFASKQFNSTGEGLPLIRIRDLKTEAPQAYTTQVHKKGHMVKPGDILVGMDGEFRPYLWGGRQAWLNQRVCKFEPMKGYNSCYVRLAIEDSLKFIEDTEVATTVIHLGKADIDEFKIVKASSALISRFGDLTDSVDRNITANKVQSRTLAELRDTLLPKLLSGELSVGKAQEPVEAAVR